MNRGNGYPVQPRNPSEGSRPSVAPSNTSNMSRAQRFENEKQRIQESCFSKVDEHGQQAESYITHLRIEEDGAHPSGPPPLDSSPEGKKQRVIIVAVRSTGRVRMHKARENNNGSFSIGKTWNLEDLSAIESYAHPDASSSPQRQINYERAGTLGFVCTIIKPYYWQAGTAKERDFFIASLVKIFRKYTKGRTPELIGFSENEREAMFGPMVAPPSRAPDARGSPAPPQPPFASQARAQSRSRDPSLGAGSNDRFTPSSTVNGSPQPPHSGSRYVSQEAHQQRVPSSQGQAENQRAPLEEQMRRPQPPFASEQRLRPQASRERMQRPITEQTHPQNREISRPPENVAPGRGSQQRLTPESSRPEMGHVRSESPNASVISASSRTTTGSTQPPYGLGVSHVSPSRQRSFQSAQSNDSVTKLPPTNGAALFHSTRDRWQAPDSMPKEEVSPIDQRPTTSDSSVGPMDMRDQAGVGEISRSFLPEAQALPERRRPPMNSRDNSSYKAGDRDNNNMDQDMRPPPLSTSRSASGVNKAQPHVQQPSLQPTPGVGSMPGAFYETPPVSNLPTPQPQQQELSPFESQQPLVRSSEATAETRTPELEKEEEEEHRPGLGPMIKKRNKAEVANAFRKAASAANAFKPRAGGAVERFKQANNNEPDGIRGVVPAPLRTISSDKIRPGTPGTPIGDRQLSYEMTPKLSVQSPVTTPAVEDGPQLGTQLVDNAIREPAKEVVAQEKAEVQAPAPVEQRKPKRRLPQQEKYITSLGIDPVLLDGKGLEFEAILSDFGWGSNVLQGKSLDILETDLKRELGRVEAGSWLGHLEQKDDRVEAVDKMLDRAIAECDELDGLLTLYSVELGTLNEDIAFIEAQSQGLQVQTANQKILHTELQTLVDTISITPNQLEALRRGSFDDLEELESTLLLLYNAMLTIDPSIRSSDSLARQNGVNKSGGNSERRELSNMNALQEKRQAYLDESAKFCSRLTKRMSTSFDSALSGAIPMLLTSTGKGSAPWSLNVLQCNASRQGLWQYSPLLLYAKEVNQPAWTTLLETYTALARHLYISVFKSALESHKKTIRATTGDEGDFLFTSVEKETSEGLTSTARKVTMKRSQTLAKTFRSASGEKRNILDTGRQMPCEAFGDMLGEWTMVLSTEQNFVVELFHATSIENMDFADCLAMFPPGSRRGPDLTNTKLMEPDRGVAEYVLRAMSTIFDFWATEIRTLIEQSIVADPMQGIGILASIAVSTAPLQESSQEYLLRTLTEASSRLQNRFTKFIDDQIRAIEDTKVKIKKRKGVIAFMRIFPHFSISVENIFVGATRSSPNTAAVGEVRQMIDGAYERINQAMWVSLKQIAKESPTMGGGLAAATQNAGADSEDKEILNYHILLIENMNHYIEEVDDGGKDGSVLARWKGKALMERAEHMDEYVKRVVRRPLGKILDFVESTETLLKHSPGPSIASKPSHSRSSAKKLLQAHDGREIRRGIDTLRKRIEKHFGEAEDEALAQRLVGLVEKECERQYNSVLGRLQRVCAEVYREEGKGVEIDWKEEDITASFRR